MRASKITPSKHNTKVVNRYCCRSCAQVWVSQIFECKSESRLCSETEGFLLHEGGGESEGLRSAISEWLSRRFGCPLVRNGTKLGMSTQRCTALVISLSLAKSLGVDNTHLQRLNTPYLREAALHSPPNHTSSSPITPKSSTIRRIFARIKISPQHQRGLD